MVKSFRNSCELWLRLGIAIVLLMVCIAVEWRTVDRFTCNAWEVRYQENLEEFRQNPMDYVAASGKETYDTWFSERFKSIQQDIRIFPIEKSYVQNVSYVDSWYGARTFGGERKHEGTDLMSATNIRGEIPVVSMTDGVVKNMGWLQLGGWRIGIEAESGVYYYYAHLDSYAGNLEPGSPVYAGQLLGFMGDSGYGEEGTVGMFDVHLHLGIYIYDEEGREISVNPYPFLVNLQRESEVLIK